MGQPTACAAGAGAPGATGAGAAVAAAGAAAAGVTGAACWGCWTCTGEPLGSAMMLPEESEKTRRPADDLPLETSLPSLRCRHLSTGARPPRPPPPTPPLEPATRGGSKGGRAGRREEAAPPEAGRGGGGGRRARRAPRASRAQFSVSARGTAAPPPSPALLAAGEVSTGGERGRVRLAFGARVPRPLTPCFPCAFAPDSRTLRKMSPGDPEDGVVEPPPGSQIQKSPQVKRT